MSGNPGLRPDGTPFPQYQARVAAYDNPSTLGARPSQHAPPYAPLPHAPSHPHTPHAHPSLHAHPHPQSQYTAPFPSTSQYAAPNAPSAPPYAPYGMSSPTLPPPTQQPYPYSTAPFPPSQPQAYASHSARQSHPPSHSLPPPHHQHQHQNAFSAPPPPTRPYTSSGPLPSFDRFSPSAAAPPPPHPSALGGAAAAPLHPTMTRSSFQPSGRRKALLVGINYTGTSAQLRGCVRDVTFVHHLLTTKFDFRSRDFVVLTDESTDIRGVRTAEPTRRNILEYLQWIVADTRPGDSLWFSFSGHGSQVRDTNGDESDGYDETILPVDYKRAGHIVDDELYALVSRVCRGSRLTVLLDACHSGTGLDLPYQHDVFGTGTGQRISSSSRPNSFTQGLMGMAGALMNGNPAGLLSAGISLATGKKKKKPHPGPDSNSGEVLLFSGCKDNQTSADTSKLAGGLTTGAMTYALIETLEHSTEGDWRSYNYRKLLQTMRSKLRANRMTQTPQFSTSHPFDLSSPFML